MTLESAWIYEIHHFQLKCVSIYRKEVKIIAFTYFLATLHILATKIAMTRYIFWHNIWKECDKPQAGQIVIIMRYTRNHYHDLIKKIKTDRNSAVKRSLGNALQSGQTRNFWSEIYKISKVKGKKIVCGC